MSKAREEKYERLYAAIQAFDGRLPERYRQEFRAVIELYSEYVQQIGLDNQEMYDQIKAIVVSIKEKTGIDIGDVLNS